VSRTLQPAAAEASQQPAASRKRNCKTATENNNQMIAQNIMSEKKHLEIDVMDGDEVIDLGRGGTTTIDHHFNVREARNLIEDFRQSL